MRTNLWRGVVAVATTFACLALMGTPTSAATILFDVAAGTLTFASSSGMTTESFPVGPGVTTLGTGCANTFTVTTTATTTSVTDWQVTAYTVITRIHVSSTWYVLEETRTSSTAGTVTSVTTTSSVLSPATLTLNVRIYNTSSQSTTETSCSTTTQRCRFSSVPLTLQGTYSGDLHNPASSHTVNLTGSGPMGTAVPGCGAPFSAFINGTATLTGFVGHTI